jgi:Flp pilus assembly protein CpaB
VENLLPKGMLGTPRRTVVAGAVALVLATILLLVYLNHYRNSVKSSNAAATVLVAKVFIPAGTSALSLAKNGQFEVASIPKDQLKDGAVTDAAVLHGQVALDDVFPGQQLTTADFGVSATSSRLSGSPDLIGTGRRTGTWRALSVTLDESHGVSPQAQTDDRVDVYAEVNGVDFLVLPNVQILAAPNQVATNTEAPVSGNYILRVPSNQFARFTYIQENGKMWLALRPQKAAKPPQQTVVTANNVIVAPR